MNHRPMWPIALAALLLALIVGIASYNAGVHHGFSTASATALQAPGPPAPVLPPPYGWPYYPRPHAFGLFPFFGVFLMFVLFRALLWGPRRCGYGRPWHHGPTSVDDWHRRAHEQMKNDPPPAQS